MKILSSWDDGAAEDIRLADLLSKYEIESIFYIPSEWESYNLNEGRKPLTEAQFDEIARFFEIGSHGVNHYMLTRIPLYIAEYEITASKDALEARLNRPVTSFCYPRGYANDTLRESVRKTYRSARNTLIGNIKVSEDPIWTTPSVHVCGNRRPEYKDSSWLEEAYKLLDQAIATEDSVYHLWGHSWEISRYDGWHDLEKLLKDLNATVRR